MSSHQGQAHASTEQRRHQAAHGADDSIHKDKQKRGYRACLHCRSRKAKCDLGDIDAPSEPPCSRCRRESRECVFAPSRRGGNNAKRRRDSPSQSEMPKQYSMAPSVPSTSASGSSQQQQYAVPQNRPPFPPATHVDILNPSPKSDYLFNHPSSSSNEFSPSTTGPSPSQGHLNGSGGITGAPPSAPPDHKRRRLHLNPPLHTSDPSSIVVADMQNESDALHILALASAGRPQSHDAKSPRGDSAVRMSGTVTPSAPRTLSAAKIEDFALVRLGIVDEAQVTRLTAAFFRFHHHLFPMVPADRIPRTPEQLADFARSERYLVTAMVIIASRHDRAYGMRQVHEQSWMVMRGWISEIICLGAPPTVGLVEALLLLAEYLPRDPPRTDAPDPVHAQGFGEEVHGSENRQAWTLTGMAIRLAYSLGIDKLALKLIPESDRTPELERARLVWTYCYLFDRHVSLRLGKAFWSRGPSICFQGFSASAQTGPAAAVNNFPYMKEIKAPPGAPPDTPQQDDFAALAQTYLELTQMMSNAHDVLYPNTNRTRALVVYGEYFKYIDELARSLDGFRILWREKKWKLFPLTDAVWAMFYYTQLYICAFSFQAHVERAAMRAEEEYKKDADGPRPPLSLFPRGAAASPDARYIFQSIEAARALLHICVDSLHPGGALPYLPNRFLLWFTYGAIVLIKAMYSGAMLRAEHPQTEQLLERLCECLLDASPDDDHPAVRYGKQLRALRQKLAGMNTSANSPTGGGTVPLPQAEGPSKRDDPAQEPWMAPSVQALTDWLPPQTQPTYPPASGYVAPPHQQPLSDVHSVNREPTINNNLGFATLEDWFGAPPTGDTANPFAGLDLADFWMKVGPGEAQGGFPFR